MTVGARRGKVIAPEIGKVRESLRRNLFEHRIWNADIGDGNCAAMDSARQQNVSGLLAKESDGFGGVYGNAHGGAGGAVDAARQIDGKDRRRLGVHALDQSARLPFNRPIEASA